MNYDLTKALVDVIKIIFPIYFKMGEIDIELVHEGVCISSCAELGSFRVNGRIYYSIERYEQLSEREVNSAITKRLKWNLVEEIWRKFPTADAFYLSKEITF